MIRQNDNTFFSGWKLNKQQFVKNRRMDYFENNNSLLLENFSYQDNRKSYLQLMEKLVVHNSIENSSECGK
jgi:hypothetical protein